MLDLVVRPGDLLACRFRVAERYGGPGDPAGTAATWWACDEALNRPVWITLLPDRDGGAAGVLAAARAAASCADPRFLRVLDVGTDAVRGGTVDYLVTEALAGPTVADLLADGPIAPERARALTLAVAAALSTAHEHGLSHRRLRLEDIRCPDASFSDLTTVRIAGLELAAALDPTARRDGSSPEGAAGSEADAPARDAEACGAVLYAALTGRWPGQGPSRLPPAPRYGGRPCSPRQVRAGVPWRLDAVARDALALHPGGAGAGAERLSTPAQVAAALADPADPPDLGLLGWLAPSRRPAAGCEGQRRGGSPREALPRRAARAGGSVRWAAGGSAPVRVRAAAVLAASAPLVLGVLGLWGVTDVSGGGGSGLVRLAGLIGAAWAAPTPAAPAPAASAVSDNAATAGTWPPSRADASPVVRAVRAFPPGGSHASVSDPAAAVDGKLETAWRTRAATADDARAGSAGGLLLDLGGATALRRVDLVLLGRPTDVEVRVGGEDVNPATAAAADYRLVGAATDSGSRVSVDLGARVPARYVLVRLLGLPAVPEAPGDVRGGVADVRLHH